MYGDILDIKNISVYASDKRWTDVQELIENNDFSEFSLIDKSVLLAELSYYDTPNLIQSLFNMGVDINYQHINSGVSCFEYNINPGTTALGQTILGAEYKHETLNTIKMLLSLGAFPNRRTYSGYTPLQLAIVKNCPEHTKLLLSAGAEPYMPSADMDKPDAFDFAQNRKWARELLAKYK